MGHVCSGLLGMIPGVEGGGAMQDCAEGGDLRLSPLQWTQLIPRGAQELGWACTEVPLHTDHKGGAH